MNTCLSELYEKDETSWLDRQVALLERGDYRELDFANLKDFLESMARRDRREVGRRLTILIEHILKWEHQVGKRTNSWRRTIFAQQDSLEDAVDAGSLRRYAIDVLPAAYRRGMRRAAIATELPLDTFPTACPWTLDEMLAYLPEGRRS